MTQEQQTHFKSWLAALRSGEYEQARGTLKVGDGYCCLGVACEVYKKETGNGEWNPYNRFIVDSQGNNQTLSFPVNEYFGIDFNPEVTIDKRAEIKEPVGYLNDTKGLNFTQIADLLEKEYLPVEAQV